MKTRISVGLCVALVASCISVRAVDNLDQAAARAAFEQKMCELDHSQAQSLPATGSATVVTQPGESTTNATNAATAKAVTVETAPAVTSSEAAPQVSASTTTAAAVPTATVAPMVQVRAETEAPTAVTPANTTSVAAPATTAPATVIPVTATPVVAPAATTPVSTAPVIEAPSAEAPATGSTKIPVAVTPVAREVAAPTETKPTAAPAIFKPTVLHAAELSPSPPRLARSAIELVTANGSIYKNVEVEKVIADGIIISYTPAGGGWAMTKVLFSDLPPELQQRYQKR